MSKFLLLIILPFALFGTPNSNSELAKDVDLMKTFDVDPSFLNDPMLNEIKLRELMKYKNNRVFENIGDAAAFMPSVKEVLNEYKVPQEFLLLAIAESNFSAKANSKSGASGVWQFMPGTANQYHLRVDKYVDERRDLIKSSRAAAKYLSMLHNQFGKWYLAVIAYNCGSGYLANAIKQAGTDKLNVLASEKHKYIPAQTRVYVRKILALGLIENNDGKFLSGETQSLQDQPSLSAVQVGNRESLNKVSQILDVPEDELKKYNHHLTYNLTPPDSNGYDIYIPTNKLPDFQNRYGQDNSKKKFIVFTPKSDDNSTNSNGKFKIPTKVIKDLNKLRMGKISPKQDVVIQVVSKSNIVLDKGAYIVKDGDTLESIANANKISVAYIKSKNSIKNDNVKAGDRLYINE
jgi:membrane-bound lytic murein transglycosylase D